MSLFPSLPANPHLRDVLRRFPKGVIDLMRFHDVLLRQDSDLSQAQRELIAAFVSGRNRCGFCTVAHDLTARAFGVDEALLQQLHDDPDRAPIEASMRPLLAYVAKVNDAPVRVTPADAQSVYDAGWSEAALYDAVAICPLFNFMNRLVAGTGVVPGPEYFGVADEALGERRRTYVEWIESEGLV